MMEFVPSATRTIIVAPLNWGLGHATRCIPIIRTLLSHDKQVIIASDGEALQLLQEAFPQIRTAALPAYKVRYNSESLSKIVLSNSLNIASAIRRERAVAKQLVRQYKADLIISDSRFGFRAPATRNIIISHQLNPQAANPFLKSFLEKGNRYYLNKFDECWIPDTADHKLSGLLSTNPKIKNQRFIGPLSALSSVPSEKKASRYDLTIILSGPEPARSKLERELTTVLGKSDKRICLVRGTNNNESSCTHPAQWVIHNRIGSAAIADLLHNSKAIISRAGYTSIMDYVHLGISAYLIPTPGQSEQEYLAESLDGKDGLRWVRKVEGFEF